MEHGRKVIKLGLPRSLVHRAVALLDEARCRGIHIEGGSGSGKSTLEALIALRDFCCRVAQVVLDPNGATVDYFLGHLAQLVADLAGTGQLSDEDQKRLWRRVRYVDMSGKSGFLVPFPLYYRLGNETLKDIAWRYLEVIERLDPKLKEAPVMGLNAIKKLGSRTGMVLAALGCQITEAEDLINHPENWERRLQKLASHTQDRGLRRAVDFFLREYPQWKRQDQQRAKTSFETNLDMFTQDERMMAMFGAAEPGINWQEVVNKGRTVLLDFRHEQNSEYRQFKMLWAFRYLLDFIKHRGRGRHQPVGLIIDELTSLYNFDVRAGADIFASDLDELINQIARDYKVWLTLAHQEAFQIDEKSHKTLTTMGTQILGAASDFEAALARAQRFFRIDPHKIKRMEQTYLVLSDHYYHLRPTNPVEYTVEEQDRMAAARFMDLGLFDFLVRPAKGEGDTRGELIRTSISPLVDRRVWNNEALVAALRQQLSKRDGTAIETVLAEIDQRQARLSSPSEMGGLEKTEERAILELDEEDDLSDCGEKRATEDA